MLGGVFGIGIFFALFFSKQNFIQSYDEVILEVEAEELFFPDELNSVSLDWDDEEEVGFDLSEEECLLLEKLAWAEARSEGIECMALVMLVVLNRVEDAEFPNTIAEVINEKNQFTPVKNGSFETAEPNDETKAALELVLWGWDLSQGALYFESCTGSSWHSRNLTYLFTCGKVRFYK